MGTGPALERHYYTNMNMMTPWDGNTFRITEPLCRESIGRQRWISHTKVQKCEFVMMHLLLFGHFDKTIDLPEKLDTYRKTSCISRTKFQTLNVSCILMQLSSLNPLKPGVKLRMKM